MNGKTEKAPLDLEQIRARLDSAKGPQYWKSLEELAATEEFQAYVQDEFPNRVPDWMDPANRRNFLKLMGASLALAGVTACTKQPAEVIVPYVRQPEDFVPGKPLFFATAMTMGGVSTGLLVESHLGRPTKVEGNPDHPGSLGSSDFFHQASLLTMYDPDRSQVVINNGHISSWFGAQSAFGIAKEKALLKKGAGFRILTESVTSPTLTAQIKGLLKELPEAKWHQFEPAARIGSSQGAMLAFGRPVNTVYRFDLADVVVSLDADFLACGPGNLRYARDFANRRRVQTNITHSPQPKEDRQEGYQAGPDAPLRSQSAVLADKDSSPLQNPPQVQATGKPLAETTMNRLYVVEPHPTPTGGMADHRYSAKPSEVETFAGELAAALGVGGTAGGGQFRDIGAIAKDLQAHRGASIVIAGEFQSPRVHALAHAMNQALGNAGKTVVYTEPVEGNPVDAMHSLKELVGEMNAGQVDTLVILGGNPVYNAPADLQFGQALLKAGTRFHLSLFDNETSVLCNWHIPEAHYLESWSDARGYDGTASIVQPLIAPLYGGITSHQVLSVLAGDADRVPYDIVKPYWQSQMKSADFDAAWQTAVHDGLIANTALPAVSVTAKAPPAQTAQQAQALELVLRPDPTIWDGTWANNGWLQELPKPQNKMTWDNAVWLGPATAQKLGVTAEDMVELRYRGKTVTGGVWIMPGHANDCATVHLGFGRTRAGHVGNGVGFNAYTLQTSDAPGGGPGLEIHKTGGRYSFATTQHTQTMEEREPVRLATLEEYKKDPQFVDAREKPIPKWETLYPDFAYEGYKWGMTIDLNSCVGCSACIIACQSENNIPVVGKIETAKGRHMASWIRVDRYFKGNWDNPELYFQPVPCMQCENAPCELVCPVAATVHSGDGLNQMIYNRCVGTRYCSNNCPYKVRRFNFFLYSDWYTPSLYGMRNPDVTVRSRGVMEKCTYCVQRINAAKIESEKQNRRIADGEVVPACVQACPTRAIEFGDINDPKSKVAQLKAQPRNYSLLEELNTRPRTTYLGRLRNPNPEIQNG
jgi:molybdopterin-containing oxidoreductase family iron-sulfur binding subunit